MSYFFRFDKSDYERLAARDRWSASDAANLFVNVQKDIDKTFDEHYWRAAADKEYWSLVNNEFMQWSAASKLIFYGPAGDLGKPLVHEGEYLVGTDDGAQLRVYDVFFMKKQILPLFGELDEKVVKRINGLLEGKMWKEPRADVTEKDLVQILTPRIIEAEEKLPTKDAIIKKLNSLGIANETSKASLYEWIGEVYSA